MGISMFGLILGALPFAQRGAGRWGTERQDATAVPTRSVILLGSEAKLALEGCVVNKIKALQPEGHQDEMVARQYHLVPDSESSFGNCACGAQSDSNGSGSSMSVWHKGWFKKMPSPKAREKVFYSGLSRYFPCSQNSSVLTSRLGKSVGPAWPDQGGFRHGQTGKCDGW